jgi:hypothetical protein
VGSLCGESNAQDKKKVKAAWTQIILDNVKEAMKLTDQNTLHNLHDVLIGMDPGKPHVAANRNWLINELGIHED